MRENDDSTAITGQPPGSGLRTGEVIAERYEVREPHRDDVFTFDYRALDQETEQEVLVRLVQPGFLENADARDQLVAVLRQTAAIGGTFLPGLSDVDVEGSRVFVVESWPPGACLREVLDARRDGGRVLDPRELLPVVARLAAALDALPPSWRHGDVRAEQVWIHPEGLQLMGPFLVPCLDDTAVAQALGAHSAARRRLAPEVVNATRAGRAADRYGVAVLTWEALTGRPPEPSPAHDLGALGDTLLQFLASEAEARPATLQPLIEALAVEAKLPVPTLDPGAFRPGRPQRRRPRTDTIREPVPSPVATDTTPDAAADVADTTSAADRTDEHAPVILPQGASAAEAEPEPQSEPVGRPRRDTIRVPPPFEDSQETVRQDGEETRQVVRRGPDAFEGWPAAPQRRAARPRRAVGEPAGVPATRDGMPTAAHEEQARGDDLDPRLMRAALDVTEAPLTPMPGPAPEPADATQEVDPSMIVDDDATRPRESAPRRRRAPHPTMELGMDELEFVEQEALGKGPARPNAKATAGPQGPSGAARPARRPRKERTPSAPFVVPEGVKPIPRARRPSFFQMPRSEQVLFDDSRVEPTPKQGEHSPEIDAETPELQVSVDEPVRRRRPKRTEVMTRPRPVAQSSKQGLWLILGSIVLAVAIIVTSIVLASKRRRNLESLPDVAPAAQQESGGAAPQQKEPQPPPSP